MKKIFIMKMAYKNLKRYKLRTFLTAGGVAISIGFITFLTSLGYGLQKVSTEQIANLEALQILDISVGKSQIVKINDETIESILDYREVESVYPEISIASEIGYESSNIDGIVYGKSVDLLDLEKPEILSGNIFSSNDAKELIINESAANKLGITNFRGALGDQISLNMIIRPELMEGDSDIPKIIEEEVKVVGIIAEGNSPYVYLPLGYLQGFGINNFSSAKIKVKNRDSVEKIKVLVEHMGFKVTSIKETVDQVNDFFAVFRMVLIGFGTIAILVSCLGMFNTLTISLIEKTREIGIMKSLGMVKKDVRRIFLAEALLIGLAGGIAGVISSYALGAFLNSAIITLAKATGNEPIEIFIFPLNLIGIALLLAIFISLLTGAYPARRASRISALDALRYE